MNPRLALLAMPLVLFTMTSCSWLPRFHFGRDSQSTQTLPLELRDVETLSVFNDVGSLRVTVTSDAPTIVVHRRYDREGDTAFTVQTRPGRLEFEARVVSSNCLSCRADLELRIPSGLRLQLQAADGEIDVRGATPELEARVDSGSIRASDLGLGHVKLGVNDGSLEVSDVSGVVDLFVDSGSIRLNRVNAALTATLMDGGITATNLRLPANSNNRVSIDSGRIDLDNLEVNGAAAILGSVDKGNLELALDGFRVERQNTDDGARIEAFRAGDEATRLELRVVDGDIVVR
jgi:hypothetical protein